METKDFLKRVLPDSGVYFTARSYVKRDGTPGIVHESFTTVQDLAVKAQQWDARGQTVYVPVGAYKISHTVDAKGKQRHGRRKTNVGSLKSFYIDVDGKEFPGGKEAILPALREICKKGVLPPSIINDSGNGYHMYWVLDGTIDPVLWLRQAERLDRMLAHLDFVIDHQITTDPARLLRPVGTHNYKDPNNPKRVRSVMVLPTDYGIQQIIDMLDRLGVEITPERVTHRPAPLDDNDPNADLLGGIGPAFRPSFMSGIIEKCAVMRDMHRTGGEKYDYPTWRAALQIAAYTEDGEKFIHELSNQHPSYAKEDTEARYQEALHNKETDPQLGPVGCKEFKAYNKLCDTCPFNVTTPHTLGQQTVEEKVEEAAPEEEKLHLPRYYSVQQNHVMYAPPASKKIPAPIPIIRAGFAKPEIWLVDDEDGMKKLMFHTAVTINKKTRACVFDVSALHKNPNVVAEYLLGFGIAISAENATYVRQFMTSWIEQLRTIREPVYVPKQPYGWAGVNGEEGFLYGGFLHGTDGSETEIPIQDSNLHNTYKAVGSLNKWKQAAHKVVVEDGRPEMQICVASAFAGPLIDMSGVGGVIISMVSAESGTGKTTAMSLSQSVWSHPVRGMNTLDDTANSVMRKLGRLRNLPAYWDELRVGNDVKSVLSMAFRITQGKEKTRLTANSEMMDSGDWSSLIVTASNEHLTSYVDSVVKTSGAGKARVFEMRIGNVKLTTDTTYMKAVNSLKSNYGVAGAAYAKYIAEHRDEVEKAVHGAQNRYVDVMNASTEERFWIAAMATCIVGAMIAKKIGLVDFDLKAIDQRLRSVMTYMRSLVATNDERDELALLGEYINSQRGHRLVTKHARIVKRQGKPRKAEIIEEPSSFTKTIRIHAGRDDGYIYIDRTAFRTWLMDNRFDPTTIVEGLAKIGGITVMPAPTTLGAGTLYATARKRLLEIDTSSPSLSAFSIASN